MTDPMNTALEAIRADLVERWPGGAFRVAPHVREPHGIVVDWNDEPADATLVDAVVAAHFTYVSTVRNVDDPNEWTDDSGKVHRIYSVIYAD